MAAAPHILIVGSGSAGRRHARNLVAEGCSLSAVDPRGDRLRDIAKEVRVEGCFETLEQALHVEAHQIQGVVVASPPKFHVQQCLDALSAGIPVLLEKPVSPDLASAQRLAAAVAKGTTPLLLGYTWRWWPSLGDVRRRLAENAIGAVRHVRFVMSAHLADWHPWERYQDFFMASAEQGGGALLDESHWVDLALWLFGLPKSVLARIERISDLDIDSDDNVDLWLEYGGGLRVSLHLDLYGRPHERSIRFVGERGTLAWEPNRLAIGQGAEGPWATTAYEHQRDDMFMACAREFLDVVRGAPVRTCSIEDGVRALRVLEAARQSQRSGRLVSLQGA